MILIIILHLYANVLERNKYMVKKSDLLICYVDSDSGGAAQTLKYAKENHKEIINIADLI